MNTSIPSIVTFGIRECIVYCLYREFCTPACLSAMCQKSKVDFRTYELFWAILVVRDYSKKKNKGVTQSERDEPAIYNKGLNERTGLNEKTGLNSHDSTNHNRRARN